MAAENIDIVELIKQIVRLEKKPNQATLEAASSNRGLKNPTYPEEIVIPPNGSVGSSDLSAGQ